MVKTSLILKEKYSTLLFGLVNFCSLKFEIVSPKYNKRMESLSLIESQVTYIPAFAKYWLMLKLVDYIVSENDNVDSDDGQNISRQHF